MALQHHWWDAPTMGEFPSLPPDQMPRRGARALRNYLVHLDRKIIPRGHIGGAGASDIGTLVHSTGAPMAGLQYWGDAININYRAIETTPLVDPWRVPINKPTSSSSLSQPLLATGGSASVTLTTGTVVTASTASTPADGVGGERGSRADGYQYKVSMGGTSTSITTGVGQLTRIVKIDPSNAVVLSNGPGFVMDVIDHYGRVWAAAGRAPGASSGYDPNFLYFSKVGGTTGLTNVLSDWQDPISGLVNTIRVGVALDDDFIVGLGRARGHLLIFKRNAVWILYGTSTEDFTLRQLRTVHGCVDARSIVVADEGCYFASQRGYELFDGTSFRVVSGPVADTWLEFSQRGPGASTTNHSYIRCSAVRNDYIHVALGTSPHLASGDSGAERNWLLHAPTGSWIQLTSAISSIGLSSAGGFGWCTVTPNFTILWGMAQWVRANQMTYGPLSGTGVRDQNASASFSVDLLWTTGLADLGDKWLAARMNRHSMDYKHAWNDNTPANLATFGTVAIADSLGSTLATPGSIPGFRTASAPLRSRFTFDDNYELPRGDIELSLASNIGSSSSARTGSLEVYGMGVEYEVGRGRRL